MNTDRKLFKEKKRWLLSYRELMQEVEDEAEKAGYWQDRAEGLSAIVLEATGVKSANHITVYDCVDEFLELARHCSELAKTADLKKEEILAAINKIEDPKCRQVLKMYYIGDKNMYQIAETMHYTLRWIQKLHDKGLEELELPKEFVKVHTE